MNTSSKKILGSLIVSLFLAMAFTTPAFAGSPSAPYPERPNLIWDVSDRKTAVVHLVNTTPYSMVLATTPFVNKVYQQAPQDYDEGPIVFAPSGVPTKIPAQSGASFVISWLDTGSGASDVKADAVMVYTIKDVDSSGMYTDTGCTVNAKKGDVSLQLEFDRVKQTKNLRSDIFHVILNATAFIVDGLTIVAEPEDALAWAGFVTNAAELAADVTEINENNEDWDQIYFNSYILAYDGNAEKIPGIYTYSDADTAAQYDGLYTQHGSTAGCPQSSLVVGTAILREKTASHKALDGNIPVVLVAVATSTDWSAGINATTSVSLSASKAGHQINEQVKREGKKGRIALFKLFRTMSQADRRVIDSAYKSINTHTPVTSQQEAMLEKLAAAFEKHATTMQTGTGTKTSGATNPGSNNSEQKTPARNIPVHKSK